MKKTFTRTFALMAATLLCGSAALAQVGRHDTIADNTIIGPGGGSFNPLLTQPEMTLNNNGDVVFRAGESGQASGLFFYDSSSGAYSAIARAGDSAGGNGTISTFGRARLNDNGDVAFDTTMSGTTGGSSDNSGIYTWNSTDGLELKVREGVTSVDGISSVGQISTSTLQGLFSSGEIGFNVDLVGASSDSDWGAWTTSGNSFNQVYREQSIGDVGEPRVKFNQNGQSSAIVVQDDNEVQLRRSGGMIANASSTNDGVDFYQFVTEHNVIDDQGNVYFTADLTSSSNQPTLYRAAAGGPIAEIAALGGAAAGGGTYGTFAGVGVATGEGQAVFANTLDGGSEALFKFDGSSVIRLATEGQAVPDGNGSFGEWGSLTSTSNSSYAINDVGVIAFENFLDGTSGGGSDDHGIFLTDGVEIVTAVREGSLVDGGTVSTLSWNGGRESDHQSTTAFNDYGQVAYRANVGGQWKVNLFTPDLNFRESGGTSWDDNANWTLSLEPNIVHDVFIDPDSYLKVDGPTGMASVRSLTIGGNGDAELNLASSSVIEAIAGIYVLEDGTLSGDGQLDGFTESAGTIAAGNSAGVLSFDDLNLLDSSSVEIEIGGTEPAEFDRLLVSGDLNLDGDLSVSLIGGFELGESMTFDFLQVAGNSIGQFNGLADGDLVANFGGTQLFIDYHSGGVSLFTLSAVPEPSALAVLGLLAASVGCRRQRP